MSNRKFPALPRRAYLRYIAAFGISILLHLILLGGFDLHLPAFDPSHEPIEAQLVQPVLPKPWPPVKPRLHKQTVAQPKPQPDQAAAAAPAIPDHADQSMLSPGDSEPYANEIQTDPVAEPDEPPQAPVGYVDMDYDVKSGREGSVLGKTHISYKAKEGNQYSLSSETEARGLASLFLSNLSQVSEGEVTESGLRPHSFLYRYGQNEGKTRKADFDWNTMQLTLTTSKGTTSKTLVDGTQDLLSFMFQFMFESPLASMSIAVVNGRHMATYQYVFEGEEIINTALGDMRTLHISKTSGAGDEKTELWLAADYRNLPVKIKKTEEDGKVYEQVVTRLDTDILK